MLAVQKYLTFMLEYNGLLARVTFLKIEYFTRYDFFIDKFVVFR